MNRWLWIGAIALTVLGLLQQWSLQQAAALFSKVSTPQLAQADVLGTGPGILRPPHIDTGYQPGADDFPAGPDRGLDLFDDVFDDDGSLYDQNPRGRLPGRHGDPGDGYRPGLYRHFVDGADLDLQDPDTHSGLGLYDKRLGTFHLDVH